MSQLGAPAGDLRLSVGSRVSMVRPSQSTVYRPMPRGAGHKQESLLPAESQGRSGGIISPRCYNMDEEPESPFLP